MKETEFQKFGLVEKREASQEDVTRINRQTLVALKAEDVFTFRIAACDDQPDRDNEQFTAACLQGLAKLYVGKTVIMDHNWSAACQTARIYDAAVEPSGKANRLVLSAYMLRNDATAPVIASIEGGILREVSVGCRVAKAICPICGTNKREKWCEHLPGAVYGGVKCIVQLEKPTDAYEVSFCAVPVQPAAGVVKAYGGEGNKPAPSPQEPDAKTKAALARIALEEKRF